MKPINLYTLLTLYVFIHLTDSCSGASSTPRMEPFAPGQVYNVSQLDRVHVLPPVLPAPTTSAGVGSVSATSTISTLVPTILKSVSRNPSSSSSLQSSDKETRYANNKNI